MKPHSPSRFVHTALVFSMLGIALGFPSGGMASGRQIAEVFAMPEASLLVEQGGRTVIAKDADRPMVPASTMKIVTALAAIQTWGMSHRFHTDFHRSADGWLWAKGYGDPYLVSSEFDRIAQELRSHGIDRLAGIGVDDSYFAPEVEIAGRSSSDNPYDAPVTALAANFNTISVVNRGGAISSGEVETPITPLAQSFGQRLGPGEHRVNLQQRDLALRYFGELLAAKLRAAGIEVGSASRIGSVPASAQLAYRHHNSRDLQAMLTAMLEYSNNFIANDLFLLLGDHQGHGIVSTDRARRSIESWVQKTFGWHGHRIEDGAGLSHGNRLSARQLLAVVKAFAPYRELLPKKGGDGRVRAKTGTLTGVNCLAGYVIREGRWEPFSLLINQPVAADFRLKVAHDLVGGPMLEPRCSGREC